MSEINVNNGAPSVLAAWNARIIFGSIAMAFAMAIVILTTWKGDHTNTLHTSAQGWGFAIIGVIIVGFGVGAGLETYLNKKS